MSKIARLIRVQAEVMKRFTNYHGNDNTLRLWDHLTKRFSGADGFKYRPTEGTEPWIANELQRLVEMELLEYHLDGKYYWKKIELPGDSNETAISQTE